MGRTLSSAPRGLFVLPVNGSDLDEASRNSESDGAVTSTSVLGERPGVMKCPDTQNQEAQVGGPKSLLKVR